MPIIGGSIVAVSDNTVLVSRDPCDSPGGCRELARFKNTGVSIEGRKRRKHSERNAKRGVRDKMPEGVVRRWAEHVGYEP